METTELRELVVAPGDFVSVYLDASHDTEDAEQTLRLRWQEVRAALEEQGADRPTVQKLEHTLLEGESWPATAALPCKDLSPSPRRCARPAWTR